MLYTFWCIRGFIGVFDELGSEGQKITPGTIFRPGRSVSVEHGGPYSRVMAKTSLSNCGL